MPASLFQVLPDKRVPHEYGPSTVGHGEAQCIWCKGTNRENAVIDANHCDMRARLDPAYQPVDSKELAKQLAAKIDEVCDVLINLEPPCDAITAANLLVKAIEELGYEFKRKAAGVLRPADEHATPEHA